jgi:hypothetical protein
MPTDRPLESLSDADIFRSAMTAPAQAQEPGPKPEPTPEPTPEPRPEPGQPVPVPPTPPPPAAAPDGVPSWRLREEAEARRVAEDRARQLESRLSEVASHLQQQKKPDFYSEPDKAAEALLLRYLQPFAEETRKERMYNSKLLAGALHGSQKVEEAETAFLEARANESLDPVDYEAVVQSPNRYDAVVKWHKKRSTLAAVGDDPTAWFNKQLEASLADPKFQAKMLERIQGDAAARPSGTRLPPTLSKSTSSAPTNGRSPGDGSDSSLWSFATSSGPGRGTR